MKQVMKKSVITIGIKMIILFTAQAWQLVIQRDKELFSMRKVLSFMERKVTEIGEDLTLL
jgi:hypothetical protein